jgi:hypothetical protein
MKADASGKAAGGAVTAETAVEDRAEEKEKRGAAKGQEEG